MTLSDSVKSCLGKYATFQGRAPRSEYWWFVLFANLFVIFICIAFAAIGYVFGGMSGMSLAFIIGYVLSILMLFLPQLAVFVRRLHDTNHSGWWYFISLVPFGVFYLFILLLTDSDDENKYGLPIY